MRTTVSHFLRRPAGLVLLALTLAACGSGGGSSKTANVRLLNATTTNVALDLTSAPDSASADAIVVSNVAPDSASAYAGIKAASYVLRVKDTGSTAALQSTSIAVAGDTSYTELAWGRDGAVQIRQLTDNATAPPAGSALVGAFSGAADVGAVDVYLTAPGADLASATPLASGLAAGLLSASQTLASGTYELRVTGAGNVGDLRLDVPQFVLNSQDVTTIVLQAGVGGVLVHALGVVQGGAVTPYKNTTARARLVSSTTANGLVSASIGGTALAASGQISPIVGGYVVVPSGAQTLSTQVNGGPAATSVGSFVAGGDYTVMVFGDAAAPSTVTLVDDNRLPANLAQAKMRLVNGVASLSTLSLTVDSASVSSQTAAGSASPPAAVTPDAGAAVIEVDSPLQGTPVFTTAKAEGVSGVTVAPAGVYSVFVLDGDASPVGRVLKER